VTDLYEHLADLAADERRLAREGLVDELAAVMAERDALVARLPSSPPPSARPALERAAALQEETTGILREARDAVAAELGRLSRGRTTVRAYTPAGASAGSVDLAG
jgi:hypothetical protein